MKVVTAGWVLPVSQPPIARGAVAIEDGRVAWVGGEADPSCPRAERQELGPGVLFPAFINAHCHLELSALRALGRERQPSEAAPGRSTFIRWVEELLEAQASLTAEEGRSATEQAIAEVEDTGTVAVADVSNRLQHLHLLAQSRLDAVVHYELLGWDPAQAQEIAHSASERVAALARATQTNVRLRLAAHAPHSVSAALLAQLADRGGLRSLHLAESPEEARFLLDGGGDWSRFLKDRGLGHVTFAPPRLSPVAYLDSLGVLGPDVLAVHCVQAGSRDIDILARRAVAVVLCPRSNRWLGVGRAPVPQLAAAGLLLGLGTDSLGSVPSLDMRDEMRALLEDWPELGSDAALRMATANGAQALGLPDLGSIRRGKRAELRYAAAAEAPEDPAGWVISSQGRLDRIA